MTDAISRQAAIDAICNACGKIDCDEMDKCEKLQLPPANNSENPNSSDAISRQQAIDATKKHYRAHDNDLLELIAFDIEQLPPANCSEFPNNSDTISRQAAIDALNLQAEQMRTWAERYAEQRKGILTAVNIVEDMPTIQPDNGLQKLADEIESFKRCVKSENSDYLTGYLCALSVVEGMIADMRGKQDE